MGRDGLHGDEECSLSAGSNLERQDTLDDILELIRADQSEPSLHSSLVDEERSVDLGPILEYLQGKNETEKMGNDDRDRGDNDDPSSMSTMSAMDGMDDDPSPYGVYDGQVPLHNDHCYGLLETVQLDTVPPSRMSIPNDHRDSMNSRNDSDKESYQSVRSRNNDAVRRSRQKAKRALTEKEDKSKELLVENGQLKIRMEKLKSDIERCKKYNEKLEGVLKECVKT